MNTDTGRIYPPAELEERYKALERNQQLDDHQAAFAQALSEGKIVPISDQVAQTMRLGQRERTRRQRRRQAAKQARKLNR